MLRTNSAKARANTRAYIMDNFVPEDYTDTPPQDWPGVARFILETFRSEKYRRANESEFIAFKDWAQGLPNVLDTCYYYNRPALDDLAGILEETEAEKAHYTEQQAEERLTWLIYRELKGAERK